jgi:hypothetical protein
VSCSCAHQQWRMLSQLPDNVGNRCDTAMSEAVFFVLLIMGACLLVLLPGEARPLNEYKWKNVSEGPILLNPALRVDSNSDNSSKQYTPGASTSHTQESPPGSENGLAPTPPALGSNRDNGKSKHLSHAPLTAPRIETLGEYPDEQLTTQNTSNGLAVASGPWGVRHVWFTSGLQL